MKYFSVLIRVLLLSAVTREVVLSTIGNRYQQEKYQDSNENEINKQIEKVEQLDMENVRKIENHSEDEKKETKYNQDQKNEEEDSTSMYDEYGEIDENKLNTLPDNESFERNAPKQIIAIGNPGTKTNNAGWKKLRSSVQLSGALNASSKAKQTLKREDSFIRRFSPHPRFELQETMDTGDGEDEAGATENIRKYKMYSKHKTHPRTVVNPDEDFYFYWLLLVSLCVLYNLWTLIVRQSFPELQNLISNIWFMSDLFSDFIYVMDIVVQLRTGYLEQGLMVYDSKKLAYHYIKSRQFRLDLGSIIPLDLLQTNIGVNPMIRFPRFLKVYRVYNYYYMVESRTVYPNVWRVLNLIHILLILAHWFGCFYYLLSEAEDFRGEWVYPQRKGDYSKLSRKYLGSLYWSTLTLTTIGDLPSPETNIDHSSTNGFQHLATRGHKSRLLGIATIRGFIFTIISYLIGVFIFATIVGQIGNVITNRNANRLEFERLLDGAKTYMRYHKVPGGMKRRVLRWYDYSWSRGRIQGGGDINTALGLLPDKLKTELALHVNLAVLKKVSIFQECQPEFLHDLVLKMKAYIFTPGDLICRKGEVAREMFIIADGILEVKSETGRVLTTMKAGDFFGEIGILNLDGLNRRTADVRSVGYSELFSLSREDVLAAMKDYPEAEEILLTLGRKRLMEAERIRRGSKNNGSEGGKNPLSTSPEFFDIRGKRIVRRIKSDVSMLKNAIRKSRRREKSKEDSTELQPLTSGPSTSKGILCRMSRVRSDENPQEDDNNTTESKIGAGLPLLQRIKLLDEKNKSDKYDADYVRPVSLQLPNKKEESGVIGAGLPLLKRLLLLKQKEDHEALLLQKTVDETTEILVSTVQTQQTSPRSSLSNSNKLSHSDDRALKLCMPKGKVKSGVTFERNESISKRGSEIKANVIIESSNNFDDVIKTNLNLKNRTTDVTNSKKLFGKPGGKSTWSTIRKATMVQKTDENNALVGSKEHLNVLIPRDKSWTPTLDSVISTDEVDIIEDNLLHNEFRSDLGGKGACENSSSFNDTFSNVNISDHSELKILETPNSQEFDAHVNINTKYSLNDVASVTKSSDQITHKDVFSNERHKVVELEKYSQRISDSKNIYNSLDKVQTSSKLTRSNSETGIVYRKQFKGVKHLLKNRKSYHAEFPVASKTINSTNISSPESNETAERLNLKSILKELSSGSDVYCYDKSHQPHNTSFFVKKPSSIELNKLMRAQTVEGYIARHSKLTKSVTFNHGTLPSPPSSNFIKSTSDFSAYSHSNSYDQGKNSANFTNIEMAYNSKSLDTQTTMSAFPLIKSSISDESPFQNRKLDEQIASECAKQYLSTECQAKQNEIKESKEVKMSVFGKKSSHSNWIEPPESKQKNFFRPGSILLPSQNSQEEEYFTSILGGIKLSFHQYMNEIQNKYLQRFQDLELEVKKRDDIIIQLQEHIQLLEQQLSEETDSVKSEDLDPPFLRGSSIDTVIQSPTLKKTSSSLKFRRSWEDHLEEETLELKGLPQSMVPAPVTAYTSIDIESDVCSAEETSSNHHNQSPNSWEISQLVEEFNKKKNLGKTQKGKLLEKGKRGFSYRRAHSCDTPEQKYGWKARSLDYSETETPNEIFQRTLFP